jgi:hypothetical protein
LRDNRDAVIAEPGVCLKRRRAFWLTVTVFGVKAGPCQLVRQVKKCGA